MYFLISSFILGYVCIAIANAENIVYVSISTRKSIQQLKPLNFNFSLLLFGYIFVAIIILGCGMWIALKALKFMAIYFIA